MTRRGFQQLLAAQALAAAPAREKSYAAEMPDMLVSYLARELNGLAAKWDRERDRIRTPADIESRNRYVRQAAWKMMHGMPEKTPLRPRVTGGFSREGYRVENVIFESRPDFPVTGNLYIPDGAGPFPAVISPCGHYADARMNPEYQYVYMLLAKSGFAVLAYDPVGQGERRQYWDPVSGKTEVGGATTEHSMPGQLLLMMGEDLTQYRVWDGIRAIDYLQTRKEVDPERIGCAGHSGGGTLTMFISAVDERVKVAVVNEGGTGHRWPLDIRPESRLGPSDVEQNLFPAAKLGVDLCDLHVAIAPRPLLALIEDFNPRFNRAAEHIRHRYSQLGAAEKFATEEATDPHSWTMKLRLATAQWLSRWFLGKPGPDREPVFDAEPPENLHCTPRGSIVHSKSGATIWTRLQAKAATLPPSPKAPARLREDLVRLLGYRKPDAPLAPRHLVTTPRKGYSVEKIEVMSEPGIYLPIWVLVPDQRTNRRAIVWVDDRGKQSAALEFGPLEKMARAGNLIVSVDVRGIGETRPAHPPASERPGEFGFLFDVETAMSYMAWYLDRSLFGMRVQDVTRAVDYALSRPDADPAAVEMRGFGQGALWALHAGALDERIRVLTCERGLKSFKRLTASDRYVHGANIMVRDALLHYDLPHLESLFEGRELRMISPVDHLRRPI